MDESTPIVTFDPTIPAHLLIGSPEIAYKQACAIIQSQLCPQSGCLTCISCRMIREQQHHAIMWIAPEKTYTRAQFEPLFEQISFARDTNDPFFFVIEKADMMPPACANSLLKSVEEPPAGYHFLFLAERLQGVVPTIRSRCAIHAVGLQESSYQNHPLFDFFTSTTFHDPTIFTKTIDQSGITEQESIELLDALLSRWIAMYRTAVIERNNELQSSSLRVISHLAHAHAHPPMPGSSKLFWKDLFLSVKENV